MKKVYHILVTAVALFAFASVTSAQETPTYYNDLFGGLNFPQEKAAKVEGGVGFNKSISSPTSDGTYWIKLEAFATGEASYTVSNQPADIVLVLDMSQSMSTAYKSGEIYYPTYYYTESNNRWTRGNFTYQYLTQQDYWYYKYEGEYYQVKTDRLKNAQGNNVQFNQGGYGWAYFEANGTTYYLDGDQVTTGEHPVWSGTGNFGNNTILWNKYLYRYKNGSYQRFDALKAAVNEFIDIIYHNDNYEDDGFDHPRQNRLVNRISIVVYSQNDEQVSRTIKGWTPVTLADGSEDLSLIDAIAFEGYDFYTYSNIGMRNGVSLLSSSSTERGDECSRTLVMFTDGIPADQNWTSNSTTVANQCVQYANQAKNTYGATVFSVLVSTATLTDNMRNYLEGVSSDYPQATVQNNAIVLGPRCDSEDIPEGERREPNFFKEAGDDLSGVFQEIAHQSGGSSDTSLSSATSTVDIVSSSFMLPTGATADNIKVFTDKCTYGDKETGVYNFEGNGILADGRTDTFDKYNEDGELIQEDVDVDDVISVTLGTKDGNPMIQVDGFDYSNLWCGKVTDEHGDESYQGYKVIIMIPIKMNPDAVGGPNVGTNMPGSGIYINPDDDKPHVEFDIPTVSLPVNVYLEKIGLKSGESAKFRIERAVIPNKENWDPETDIAEDAWTYVSTVFVTNSPNTPTSAKGNPMVKVRGMPATITIDENNDGQPDVGEDGKIIQIGVVYRITEENWAWSYTILNTEEYPNPQYTVTSKVENPFAFKNEPIDHIDIDIRHAESKATNIFKAVGEGKENVLYDDSKPRKKAANEGEGNGGE